jgi:PAS fold
MAQSVLESNIRENFAKIKRTPPFTIIRDELIAKEKGQQGFVKASDHINLSYVAYISKQAQCVLVFYHGGGANNIDYTRMGYELCHQSQSWKDKNGRYLNCNDSLIQSLGFLSKKDIIGKTDYDLWPDQAPELRINDEKVMKSATINFFQEIVDLSPEGKRYFTVIKMPLLDENGDIAGIIGNSLEIT